MQLREYAPRVPRQLDELRMQVRFVRRHTLDFRTVLLTRLATMRRVYRSLRHYERGCASSIGRMCCAQDAEDQW